MLFMSDMDQQQTLAFNVKRSNLSARFSCLFHEASVLELNVKESSKRQQGYTCAPPCHSNPWIISDILQFSQSTLDYVD